METKSNTASTMLQALTQIVNAQKIANNNKDQSGDKNFASILESADAGMKQAATDPVSSAQEKPAAQDSENGNAQDSAATATGRKDTGETGNAPATDKPEPKQDSGDSNNAATASQPQDVNAKKDASAGAAEKAAGEEQLKDALKALGLSEEEAASFMSLFTDAQKNVSVDEMLLAADAQLQLVQNMPQTVMAATDDNNGAAAVDLDQVAAFLQKAGVDADSAQDVLQQLQQIHNDYAEAQPAYAEVSRQETAGATENQNAAALAAQPENKNIVTAKSDNKTAAASPAAIAAERMEIKEVKAGGGSQQRDMKDDSPQPRIEIAEPGRTDTGDVAAQKPLDNTAAPVALAQQNNAEIKYTAPQAKAENTNDLTLQGVSATGGKTAAAAGETAASAKSAALPREVSEKGVIEQILQKLSVKGNDQQSEVKIKLDPPALGTVRMNITSSGDSVKAAVIAENQAVKQVIEGNLAQLRESLASQGLKVESFTVSVGGEQGNREQFQQQPGFRNNNGAMAENWFADAPAPAMMEYGGAYAGSGRLSVFA